MAEKALQMQLFGNFVLSQEVGPVADLDAPRMQALLAYLALHHPTPQPRQRLAFALWPDSNEQQARTNLRNLLHRLRQAWPLADQFLAVTSTAIGWQDGFRLHLDTAVFQQLIQQATTAVSPSTALSYWQKAIDHYPHDLLPDCYDEWLAPERQRLRQLFLQALETTIQLLEEQQAYQTAVQISRKLIEAEPLRESAYRQLMRQYSQLGDRAAALRIYYQCSDVLQRELGVKPAPETQNAYRRLLALDAPVDLPQLPPPLQTNLIGRQLEWTQLTAVWQQLAPGSPPTFILISGEAGIGKTWLAEQFVAWVGQQGGVTAVAACYAAETQLAFGPVASWLRALNLGSLTPVWRTELARLLPELSLQADSPPPDAITEAWQKRRFYEAVAQAVEAQQQPICLLLEDMQWADAETLVWLHYLLRRNVPTGLLVVTTWRSEAVSSTSLDTWLPQWRKQSNLLHLEPTSLTVAETAALAATQLGSPLPANLIERLHQQTEGNPLFIVETLRHLLAEEAADNRQNRLARLTQQLNADTRSTAAPLPPQILTILRARLDQLSPIAYSLAEIASVIGRSFTIQLLQQVSDLPEAGLITAVDELWQRRIIRDQADELYDFSHGKLRQVAYQAISPARRRWLHGRVAQALADAHLSPNASLAGRIAFHYEAAGQAELAFTSHRQAAQLARQVYASQEALFHLQHAIGLRDRVPAATANLATLYTQLGEAHTSLGQHDEARHAFTTALNALPAAAPLPRAEILLNLAKSWLAHYELEKARQLFEQVAHLLGNPAHFTPTEWHIWLDNRLELFDVAYFAANLPQMAAMVSETEPLLVQHGNVRQRIRFYHTRAQWHSRQTRFRHQPEEIAYNQAALRLAQEAGDELLQHTCRFALGFMLLWQAQPDPTAAAAELELAAAGGRATGNVPLLDRCLAYLSIAYRLQGAADQVEAVLPHSLATAESEENGSYIGVVQAHQAWLAARARRWGQVVPLAQAALDQWQKLVFPFRWLAAWP
jgi:DNA-binding SARP family transcriptional activator